MLELSICLFGAIVVVSIIAFLTMWVIETHTGKVAAIATVAFVLLVGAAAAGRAEEIEVEVIDFDLAHSEVILVDNAGEAWSCPLGEHSWEIGERYTMKYNNGLIEIID